MTFVAGARRASRHVTRTCVCVCVCIFFPLLFSDLFRPIRGPSARQNGKPNSKATRGTLRKPRQEKSTAGKHPRLTARPAGASQEQFCTWHGVTPGCDKSKRTGGDFGFKSWMSGIRAIATSRTLLRAITAVLCRFGCDLCHVTIGWLFDGQPYWLVCGSAVLLPYASPMAGRAHS